MGMAKMVRCKSCGYIMPEGKLRDKCPACGVPAKMFEPFEDPVGEARRRLLDAHLHPIAVHFSTAFAASLVLLTAGTLIFSGRVLEILACTARLISLFLPLLVLASFLLGLLDGRTRFRSVGRSEILKKKVIYGLLFLVFSAGLTLVVWLQAPSGAAGSALAVVLAVLAFVCSVVLGGYGGQILNSAFPGK
jgi:O-antigen/teichoic acid export membrane protein